MLKYTEKLKNCVKDVTETTFVVPKLSDGNLVERKLDSLNRNIDDLQRMFGYKPSSSNESDSRAT